MIASTSNLWKADLEKHIKYWENRANEINDKINSMVIKDPIEIKRMRNDFLQEMHKDLAKFDKLAQLSPTVCVKIIDDTNEIRVQKEDL